MNVGKMKDERRVGVTWFRTRFNGKQHISWKLIYRLIDRRLKEHSGTWKSRLTHDDCDRLVGFN
jgi:hypothetical protein